MKLQNCSRSAGQLEEEQVLLDKIKHCAVVRPQANLFTVHNVYAAQPYVKCAPILLAWEA